MSPTPSADPNTVQAPPPVSKISKDTDAPGAADYDRNELDWYVSGSHSAFGAFFAQLNTASRHLSQRVSELSDSWQASISHTQPPGRAMAGAMTASDLRELIAFALLDSGVSASDTDFKRRMIARSVFRLFPAINRELEEVLAGCKSQHDNGTGDDSTTNTILILQSFFLRYRKWSNYPLPGTMDPSTGTRSRELISYEDGFYVFIDVGFNVRWHAFRPLETWRRHALTKLGVLESESEALLGPDDEMGLKRGETEDAPASVAIAANTSSSANPGVSSDVRSWSLASFLQQNLRLPGESKGIRRRNQLTCLRAARLIAYGVVTALSASDERALSRELGMIETRLQELAQATNSRNYVSITLRLIQSLIPLPIAILCVFELRHADAMMEHWEFGGRHGVHLLLDLCLALSMGAVGACLSSLQKRRELGYSQFIALHLIQGEARARAAIGALAALATVLAMKAHILPTIFAVAESDQSVIRILFVSLLVGTSERLMPSVFEQQIVTISAPNYRPPPT